jgi:AcrR family transcriptional regulator
MARINKGALTRIEIVTEATKKFLKNGYSNTSISAVARELEMSQGNLTFHYPTKEHLLAVLVDILCDFQWKYLEHKAGEGINSVMAICLELTSMASAAEDDESIKDFFLSAYSSPMCLDIIRKNDAKRANNVFAAYCPDWTEEQFAEAEILVSGIEFATLIIAGDPVPLDIRITGALHNILGIYGVPEEVRNTNIQKVLTMDYKGLSKKILEEFKEYVAKSNHKTFLDIIEH